MNEFGRLADRAKEVGLHVELVASPHVVRKPGVGVVLERRAIVELRLTHDSGRVVATEAMRGIGDRDRAALALRERLKLLKD